MRFDVECVRDCLVRNGIVFTVRGWKYENEWCKSDLGDLGERWLKRILVKEVSSKADLVDYVKLSGFDSVEEWFRVIEGFCRGKRKWLYVVFVPALGVVGSLVTNMKTGF